MFSTTTLTSIQQDPAHSDGFRIGSIACVSLVPLAGPILVPILLDKLGHPNPSSGKGKGKGWQELDEEAKDGTSFVWISV